MGTENLPRTIDLSEDGSVAHIVDQTRLPQELIIKEITTWEAMVDAIKRLEVRGAPALGVAGAQALALYAHNQDESADAETFLAKLDRVGAQVATARPTAVNLSWGVQQALDAADDAACMEAPLPVVKRAIIDAAQRLRDEDEASCRAIGKAGAALLPEGARILTHCNAGSLACAFYGTALGVVYAAFEEGKVAHVYADETRPVCQGARLTAWELGQAGVPTTLICDNMAASIMAAGKIDAVVVGADRICANGDTANKIGTYGLAVLAHHHNIPFYVAAPCSTIDWKLAQGSLIPIEERDANEVTDCIPEGVEIFNPAFDVTPAELITAIVTEKGAVAPTNLRSLKL